MSQNAKQAALPSSPGGESRAAKFSYTLYNALGRITEVGQKPKPNGVMNQNLTRDPQRLSDWLNNNKKKEQITRTVYDVKFYDSNDEYDLTPQLYQRNLRNRVSYTQVFDVEPSGNGAMKWYRNYTVATHYTYDIHGNVDTLLQDYNTGSMSTKSRFKMIAFDYDLISGKVNMVEYQPPALKNGKLVYPPDYFVHRYQYDAENRLTDVETSSVGTLLPSGGVGGGVWEKDARYFYYKHGPLARTILGQNQVQGIDYAYTLQGWLKGVNSTIVGDGNFDMGGDAKAGGGNSNIGRDAYGFSLNYFTGDYKPISKTTSFANVAVANDLFNGNINAMAVNIPKLGEAKVYGYKYDQLNRLIEMDAFNGLNNTTNVFTPVSTSDYKERLTYDANGNIKSYLRNGNESSLNLNDYGYSYIAGTNRLQSITNSVNQQTKNYDYDEIGNTIRDEKQGVTKGVWNLYGKLQSLTNKDGVNIRYTYDASGQRISKQVGEMQEWYVKDASGNTMATYKTDASLNNGHLTATEFYKYGSSLVSIKSTAIDVEVLPLNGNIQTHVTGNDGYILSDHSGNTRVIVSDKKIQHSSDGLNVDYYTADVKNANYYSTYGAISKTFGSTPVLAFNGQSKSTEISSDAQTAEFWEYNGDVGRRWNVDPRPDFSISPFNVFAGNPVLFSDLLGDTTRVYGNAQVTGSTLVDKGGVNESASEGKIFKGAQINPVYAKDNKTLVGYNVYDVNNRTLGQPILQLENNADLASFKENYALQFGGAQIYYANGEPSDGYKKISAGIETENYNLVWQGVKEENKKAWSDPVFVAQMLLSTAHVGVSIADRSSLILPNREQTGLTKFRYDGVSAVTGGRSGGKGSLLGKPNTYIVTKGGHLVFYEANGKALWDVSKERVKLWEWNRGFPKDGGYITRDVPNALKNIIDASKK